MSNNWPIPEGLSPAGVTAAEAIRDFLVERGVDDHGGGGRFYSPTEWHNRGERYGLTSLLIVAHDGGDHAPAFNLDYEQYGLHEALRARLSEHGLWAEQCTSWYTAIYPVAGGSEC